MQYWAHAHFRRMVYHRRAGSEEWGNGICHWSLCSGVDSKLLTGKPLPSIDVLHIRANVAPTDTASRLTFQHSLLVVLHPKPPPQSVNG